MHDEGLSRGVLGTNCEDPTQQSLPRQTGSGGECYQQWRRLLSGRQRDGGGAGAAGMLTNVQKERPDQLDGECKVKGEQEK